MGLVFEYDELLTGDYLIKDAFKFEDFKKYILDYNDALNKSYEILVNKMKETLQLRQKENKTHQAEIASKAAEVVASQEEEEKKKQKKDNSPKTRSSKSNRRNGISNTQQQDNTSRMQYQNTNSDGKEEDDRNEEEPQAKYYDFKKEDDVRNYIFQLYQKKYAKELKTDNLMNEFSIFINFVKAYWKKYEAEQDVGVKLKMQNNISKLTVDNYHMVEETIVGKDWSIENSYLLANITSDIVPRMEIADTPDDEKKSNKTFKKSLGDNFRITNVDLNKIPPEHILLDNRKIIKFAKGGIIPSDGQYKQEDESIVEVKKGQFMNSDRNVVTLQPGEIGTDLGVVITLRVGQVARPGYYMTPESKRMNVTYNHFLTKDNKIVVLKEWQLGTDKGDILTFDPKSKSNTDTTFTSGLIPSNGYFKEKDEKDPILVYKGDVTVQFRDKQNGETKNNYDRDLRRLKGDYITKNGVIKHVTAKQTGFADDGNIIEKSQQIKGGRSRSRPCTSRGTRRKNPR